MNTKENMFVVRRILGAALGVAVTASVSAANPVVIQPASNGYNAWPIVQAVGSKVVCAYSRGTAHDISQGGRSVYARTSSDGGATWGDEVTVANDAAYGEVAIGKGLDVNGAMLLWVRCWGGTNPHHDLYRTTDGIAFEKIATPSLNPVPMQITDIFAVPGVGLMCLWFSDGYAASSVRAWGKLVSADNGLSWTRTTIETGLTTDEWPTEPSGVWLGDGKILVIARCEGADRQFQIVSTDSGATWTKRQTNITDVRMSTPSLVYDANKGLVSNYYYQRGAKLLKRRVASAADIINNPNQWPLPELLYTGEETVDIDAGNVNVTVMSDGTHLAATYTGTSSNTKVIALDVAAPSQAGVLPGSVILPPAKCYSQRGLVLQLDGRENVGAGIGFDPDATVWKDLSPSGNDANLTANGDFENGAYGLQMKIVRSDVYYAAVTKNNLTAGKTAECLVKPTGGDAGMTTTVWGGGGSNGDNIPLARARYYGNKFCFDDNTSWKSGVVLGNVYQFSLRSTDGVVWTGCNDGIATTMSYAPGSKIASAPMALGGFTGYPRRLTGTLYALRVYDRPLNELEMRANAIMDHIRFEGVDPMTAEWPDGFRYDLTTGEVLVHVQLSAQRGLLVSLNGSVPAASVDKWIVRGTPYEARVVSAGERFEKWRDRADELTEAESRSETLTLYADMPRELVAGKFIQPLGKDDWKRFRHESKITFTTCGIAASTPVADIPVLLRISSDCPSGINFADIASDGSDLAFASCSNGAWLDCCVDTWGEDGGCVWVRIPSLSENTAIKMYWGLKDASDLWTATDTNVWANYTAVLHMNEKVDISGNRVDSTRKNAFALDADVSMTDGVVGLAAKSSNGGSVRVAKGGPWEQAFTSESFTMSMWLRIDRSNHQYPLFAQWASGANQLKDGLWFGAAVELPSRADNGAVIWHGGNRTSEANHGPSKAKDSAWPTGASYDKKWLHYTLTCKNDNGVAHTVNYIDGQKVNEIDVTITNGKSKLFTAPSPASDLYLVNGPGAKTLITQMDEFRLSTGIRTPAEVAADYQTMTKADFATFGRCRTASAPVSGLVILFQ